MGLHGVLQQRMNMVFIVRCRMAIPPYAIEMSIAKGAPLLLVPETTGTFARITSASSRAVSGSTMHEDLIG
jgi:hypothetical protein